MFPGIAEFQVGVHRAGAGPAFAACKIARGLLDEGDEGGLLGEIVGEVVEPGSEQHHAALADAFLQQERRLVGQANDHASQNFTPAQPSALATAG